MRESDYGSTDVNTSIDIASRLGDVGSDDFERICYELLKREFPAWDKIEPRFNRRGKSTPGTPDAHVRLEDGTYIAFQFTTQDGGIRDKVLKDIGKIASPQCEIGPKTVEVVVCINAQVGDEHETYHAAAKKHDWRFQIFSLHTLASLLTKHADLCNHFLHTSLPAKAITSQEVESTFEAGQRVRQIREVIDLDFGHFMEAVDLRSERDLRQMEAGDKECPESLLVQVANLSGASLNWLKYGSVSREEARSSEPFHAFGKMDGKDQEQRFPIYRLPLYNVEQALEELRAFQPENTYFCVEPKSLRFMILLQSGTYHWRVFDIGLTLDFWKWVEDFKYFGRIYALIDTILKSEEFGYVSSCCVPAEPFSAVIKGVSYPKTAVGASLRKGRHWAEDLLDIYQEKYSADEYDKDNGAWLPRVHRIMRECEEGGAPEWIRRQMQPAIPRKPRREEPVPDRINLLPRRKSGAAKVILLAHEVASRFSSDSFD